MEVEMEGQAMTGTLNNEVSIDGNNHHTPQHGCLIHGKAYEVVPEGLYKTNTFGKLERVKTLSPQTVSFIKDNPNWMSSPEKRREVYNDPAIRLCHKEVRDIEFDKLPLIKEHSDRHQIGNILSGSLNSNGFIQITASITDPKIMNSVKNVGKLSRGAFSIGYGAKLSNDGNYTVENKVIEEISLVEKPLFKNCVVDVYASEVLPDGKEEKRELPFPTRIRVFCGVDEGDGGDGKNTKETESNTATQKMNTTGNDIPSTRGSNTSAGESGPNINKKADVGESDNNARGDVLLKKNNKNMELDEDNTKTSNLIKEKEVTEVGQRVDSTMDNTSTGENANQDTGLNSNAGMERGDDSFKRTTEVRKDASDVNDSNEAPQKEHRSKAPEKMSKSELLAALAQQRMENEERSKFFELHKNDLAEIKEKKQRELNNMIEGALKMTIDEDDVGGEKMDEIKEKFGSVESFLKAASSSDQHKSVVDFFNSAIENNNKKTEELNKLRSKLEEYEKGGANKTNTQMQSNQHPYQSNNYQQQMQANYPYGRPQQPLQETVKPGFNFSSNTFGMPNSSSNVNDLLIKASDNYKKRSNHTTFSGDRNHSNEYESGHFSKKPKKEKRIETRRVNPESWTESDYVHVSKGLCGLLECNGWANRQENDPIYIRCSEQLVAKTNYDVKNDDMSTITKVFNSFSPDPRFKMPTHREIGGTYCLKQKTERDPNSFIIKASEDPFEFNPVDQIPEKRLAELKEMVSLPLYATTGASENSILQKLCIMDKMSQMMNGLGSIAMPVKM